MAMKPLQLNFPALKQLPPALAKFQVQDLYYVRYANAYDAKGKTRTSVVVVTGRSMYICTPEGGMERSVPLQQIHKLTVCTHVRRTLLKSTTERQVLVKVQGEHDVLFGIYSEPKNGPEFQGNLDFELVMAEVARVTGNTDYECKDMSSTLDPKEGIFSLAVLVPPTGYIDSKQKLMQQRALVANAGAYPELLNNNAKFKKVLLDEQNKIEEARLTLSTLQSESGDAGVKALIEKVSGIQNFLNQRKATLQAIESEIAALNTSIVLRKREYDDETTNKKQLLQRAYDEEGSARYAKHNQELELRRNAHKKTKDKLLARIAEYEAKLATPRAFTGGSADQIKKAKELEAEYLSVVGKVWRERDARMLEEKFRESFERDLAVVTKSVLVARSQLDEVQSQSPAPLPPVTVQPPSAPPAGKAPPPKPAAVNLFDDDDLLSAKPVPKAAPPSADIDLI
jgi:hypothetical protein